MVVLILARGQSYACFAYMNSRIGKLSLLDTLHSFLGQDKARTELGKRNRKLEKKKKVNKKRKKVSKSSKSDKSREQ